MTLESMLEMRLFVEYVTLNLKDYLPLELKRAECQATVQQKNNGVNRTGICLRLPGQKFSPVIYMEPYYEKVRAGESMDTVIGEIAELCVKSMETKTLLDAVDFCSYESIKKYLSVKLIHTEANREELSRAPHRQIEDLSVVYRIELPYSNENGIGSVKVTNGMLETWGVSSDEVHDQAMGNAQLNSPPVLSGMHDILSELTGTPSEPVNLLKEGGSTLEEGMYVLTNDKRCNGAAVLAYPGVAEQISELIPQGYYVLPSSVHEVLIIPKNKYLSAKELGEMVREVNKNEVTVEERLSDRVYEFDRKEGRIRQVPESVEKRRSMER